MGTQISVTAGYTVLLCDFPRAAPMRCSALLLASVSSSGKLWVQCLDSIKPPLKRGIHCALLMHQGSLVGSSPLSTSSLQPGLWPLETYLLLLFQSYGSLFSHCSTHSLVSTCQTHEGLLKSLLRGRKIVRARDDG